MNATGRSSWKMAGCSRNIVRGGSRRRRRGSLHHDDDRLPGGSYRSVVSRSDRLHDLSTHRQLRSHATRRPIAATVDQRHGRAGVLRRAEQLAFGRWIRRITFGSTISRRSRGSIRAHSPGIFAVEVRCAALICARIGIAIAGCIARASPPCLVAVGRERCRRCARRSRSGILGVATSRRADRLWGEGEYPRLNPRPRRAT